MVKSGFLTRMKEGIHPLVQSVLLWLTVLYRVQIASDRVLLKAQTCNWIKNMLKWQIIKTALTLTDRCSDYKIQNCLRQYQNWVRYKGAK